MRIGVLGSGLMGGKLGTLFARAGHEVVFSYSRSERKLKTLARLTGGRIFPSHDPVFWQTVKQAPEAYR